MSSTELSAEEAKTQKRRSIGLGIGIGLLLTAMFAIVYFGTPSSDGYYDWCPEKYVTIDDVLAPNHPRDHFDPQDSETTKAVIRKMPYVYLVEESTHVEYSGYIMNSPLLDDLDKILSYQDKKTRLCAVSVRKNGFILFEPMRYNE